MISREYGGAQYNRISGHLKPLAMPGNSAARHRESDYQSGATLAKLH
jgi:hypothetical protein